MNDYQFKLFKIQGIFTWYDNPNPDEVFIVIEGSMEMELRSQKSFLSAGGIFVFPEGVEHKTFSENEFKIMVLEPQGIDNKCEVGGELTASNDIWI